MSDKCSICDSDVEEDEAMQGYFGICPVSFCCWCYSSMTDMVIQLNDFDDIDTLEERVRMIKEDNEIHRNS